MNDMLLRDWITIAAVILGPIFAVQTQRFLESRRDRRARRLAVFHTLMATRAGTGRLSRPHVEALNQIDIEFYGVRLPALGQFQTPREKGVTNSWHVYSDHLNNQYPENESSRWYEDSDKLLAKLLFELSRALGYDFDEVQLRRNVYSPIAQRKQELQDITIRDALEKLLTQQTALAVIAYPPPPQPSPVSQTSTSVQSSAAAASTLESPTLGTSDEPPSA